MCIRDSLQDVDEIWHAGDIGSLELAEAIAAFKPLRAVSGNIDGGLTPVSYTHLDVYKRQSQKYIFFIFFQAEDGIRDGIS